MSKPFEVYKCEVCGNVVELLYAASDNLTCCDKPMKLMTENISDGPKEKHIPIIEKDGSGCKVVISSVLHPMEEKHWIEWIEIITTDGYHLKKFLKPGDAPEAHFNCPIEKVAYAREYCNLHGLWRS